MKIGTHAVSLSPSVKHITEILEERIRSGAYKIGRWLPSEREISEEFGVSRIVIRAVVEELERRSLVMRSARCRPIVQNVRGIRVPATATARGNLGLWIWPSPASPGSSMIVRGIRKVLDDDAFRLVVASPIDEDWAVASRSEAQFLQRMGHDKDILGIILWYLGGRANLPTLQELRAAGIPLVFIDRQPPTGFDADYVGVDNERAAEEIVKHLLAQGHRRIAHVTNCDTASTVAERLAGYRRALEVAGNTFYPELVIQDQGETGDDPNEGCEALIDGLLSLPDPPTAFFAVNDYVAQRVLAGLRARGIQVPEQIAVAGFDGVERWTPGQPFLTTANQPFERIGAKAVEVLLQRIDAGPGHAYQHILLEAPLSIHDSTCLSHRGGGRP
jgi:DNA-binding LacI/PurR family transcriptional regulator